MSGIQDDMMGPDGCIVIIRPCFGNTVLSIISNERLIYRALKLLTMWIKGWNMKRNSICSAVIASIFLGIAAPFALAIDQPDFSKMVQKGDLGTLSQNMAEQRTILVRGSTKYINVNRDETVKIENQKGQSFVWKFDTLGEKNFPLHIIAPRDFESLQTRVFVSNPYTYNSD